MSVILVFSPGVSAADGAKAVRAAGGKVDKPITHVFSGALAKVPEKALAGLARNPNVRIIEVDGTVEANATQPQATWGLDRVDQRVLPLDGTYTYDDTAGLGVAAYIVDTGVRADHAEFGQRVASGFTAITDGQGTSDCNGHGTHVAGTVAGSTWGVAKAATIVPVRVLGCNGSGTWSGVVAGLDWIAQQHVEGAPAVANLSLGGGASSTVDAAVQGVVNDGVTVVVAAGNSNADACTASPAREPSAITVAAVDRTDTRASFSNWGNCVDLFAPGVSITSASISSTTASVAYSGTSMASPHVAGAAALLLGVSPSLSPASVSALLLSTATPDVVIGPNGSPNRLLHVAAAVQPPTATEPEAPTGVTATVTARRTVLVEWIAPEDRGDPITSYTVTAQMSNGSSRTFTAAASSTSLSIRVRRGVYTFTVRATNGIGTGPDSTASNAVTVK